MAAREPALHQVGEFHVGAVECRRLQRGLVEGAADQPRAVEHGLLEAGAVEGAEPQIGLGEMRTVERAIDERRFLQVGATEVAAREIAFVEDGTLQDLAGQRAAGESDFAGRFATGQRGLEIIHPTHESFLADAGGSTLRRGIVRALAM